VVIEKQLGIPEIRRLWEALPEARIAGGAVRDMLLERPVADVDFATPLSPEATLRRLADANIKTIPTGLAHGTITAIIGRRAFEITSLRRDIETDGRHAVVAFTDNWQEDAARRDFTINAMSMTPEGMVHDYFGGVDDLRAGLVRFVGDPATRIAEDYLRILRFFRFQARYGGGAADPSAIAAIRAGVPGMARLSTERVWSELKRILAVTDPGAAVALMRETAVLAAVLPEGASADGLARLVAAGAPPDPLLRLAALLDGDAAALAARLRFSVAERDRLLALRGGDVPPPDVPADAADDATLRRALADTPADILIGRAWLAGRGAALRERLAAIPRPVFPLQGRDLLAAGVAPGPALGQWLRHLRRWWMDGGCVADAPACRAELARRLAG